MIKLLPYQQKGVDFLTKSGSALLGDDVGLGKTIQAIMTVEADPTAHRILVLCPNILKFQWAGELEKFLDPMRYTQVVVEGNPAQRKNKWGFIKANTSKTYFIANYELLLRDLPFMQSITWDYIIADEATKISNPTAKQVKALKTLRSRKRLALTGTPVSNRPNDLWSIIDWLYPQSLHNYFAFVNRYCVLARKYSGGHGYNQIVGYKNMEELRDKIKPYYIRRLKEEVLPELPEKIESDVIFPLTEEEQKLYSQIKKELLLDIQRELIDKIETPVTMQYMLVKMTRLRQLCDSMELLGQSTTSSKLEALKEILASLGDRKVIIFTEFSKMADIIERDLFALKISGDVDNSERAQVLEIFNNSRSDNLLVMTSAGELGLNIQAASVIIFYDQPWSLAKQVQRIGRAHRMGQKNSVLVYNLLAKGSVDLYVQKKLLSKKELSDRLMPSEIQQLLEQNDEG